MKVFGYINNFRRAYKRIKQREFGVIINVIGTGGKSPVATYAAGASGNAALMSLTRALGGASLEDGIRVVGVNPGPIMTDRLEGGFRIQAEKRFGDSSRWAECMDGFPTFGDPSGTPHPRYGNFFSFRPTRIYCWHHHIIDGRYMPS